jgi:hypothetical protein
MALVTLSIKKNLASTAKTKTVQQCVLCLNPGEIALEVYTPIGDIGMGQLVGFVCSNCDPKAICPSCGNSWSLAYSGCCPKEIHNWLAENEDFQRFRSQAYKGSLIKFCGPDYPEQCNVCTRYNRTDLYRVTIYDPTEDRLIACEDCMNRYFTGLFGLIQ